MPTKPQHGADGAPVDHTLPEGKWTFDAGVTDVFDDMLARSIPDYEAMRAITSRLGAYFVIPGRDVVDVGCSRGEALVPFVRERPAAWERTRFIGLEISEPMLHAARQRFQADEGVEIRCWDIRHGLPPDVRPSLVLSILTLQFTPIEYRQQILSAIESSLSDGGALVLVEKVLGADALLDRLQVENYLRMKEENGYSHEEIVRKKAALEGVLVPVTARMNEDLLRHAGFAHIECIWRWGNFAGWLAVKAGNTAAIASRLDRW